MQRTPVQKSAQGWARFHAAKSERKFTTRDHAVNATRKV